MILHLDYGSSAALRVFSQPGRLAALDERKQHAWSCKQLRAAGEQLGFKG